MASLLAGVGQLSQLAKLCTQHLQYTESICSVSALTLTYEVATVLLGGQQTLLGLYTTDATMQTRHNWFRRHCRHYFAAPTTYGQQV